MEAAGNYQTCCRLCLCERVEDLKSVYDESIEDRSLPQKISHFLSIEINNPDKLTTLVCSQCVAMINNWQEYKIQCSQNQIKLAEWLHRTSNGTSGLLQVPFLNGFGEPIQIKTEPMDDMPLENGMMLPWVKSEPMEPDISLEAVYDDFESMQNTPQLRENREPVEERTCSICNKEFSSSHNRKKHEKQLHGRNQPMRIEHYIRKSMMEIEPAGGAKPPEETEPKEQAEPPTEAEQQKILFAAGLKLLQTDSTPISCEELSKIEFSYIEKCKAMLNMHRNLECACHKVQHANIKGLLSHLRSLRIWFPVFTCYNCMITFTDRSTFTRHNVRCPNSSLDTLTKLSNLRKRSEVKTRLYQNFKCTQCCFMFSFHEDYIKHVDEEHSEIQLPCQCSCTRNFENLEDYKDHVYVSCLVEYYCDICFITTKTLEEFQKHAVELHDSSEGFILLQDDNYKMRKPPVLSPKEAVDESVILTGKRERRLSKVPMLDLEDEEESSTKYYDPAVFGTPRSFCKTCPICGKEYSSYNNMMRHYKTHPEAVINGDGEPVGLIPDIEEGSYYSCPDCGGVYSADEWQDHLSLKHKPKSCGECAKVFQFQTELDQHRSVHLNIKVYRDSKTHSLKTAMISPSQDNAEEGEDNANNDAIGEEDAAERVNEEDIDPELESEAIEVTPEIEIRDKRFYCQTCDEHFPNYGSLWEHNKRHHTETKPVVNTYPKQCPNCDKVLQTGAAYARHKMIHEKPPADAPGKAVTVKKENVDEESYHTCKKCFKVFSSRYNLKNHLKTHGIRIPSPTGKRPTTIKKEVEDEDSQEASTSNGPVLYTCDICVMSYTTKMGLRKHKETHMHEDKSAARKVYCKYCKIPFLSVMALNKHMFEEHDENVKSKGNNLPQKSKNAFTCHICKKSFSTSPALATHIGWHKRGNLSANSKVLKVVKTERPDSPVVTTNPFQCKTCLAVLPNDTALQVHILEKHRSVSAIMLVPRCNTCNQDFSTQDEYETHKRLHDFLERQKQHEEKMKTGQVQVPAAAAPASKSAKNFPCKYCTAGFSRSDTLGAHVRQFHKEFVKTEFRCMECDRVFDKANSLSIHMKVHEKQRANAAAAAANTAKPLFSCSICNMGFDLPKDLRAHTISAHPF